MLPGGNLYKLPIGTYTEVYEVVELRLSGRVELMLERVSAILENILGREPKPEEVVELALERLLQEFDSRYEYLGTG